MSTTQMRISITHDFCAAHRIYKHTGKCKNLHGHNYRVSIEVESLSQKRHLSQKGVVMDFSHMKALFGKYLDNNWDHHVILFEQDPLHDKIKNVVNDEGFAGVPFNPTAENMAHYLLGEFNDLISDFLLHEPHDIVVTSVTVEETPKNKATATRVE